MSYEISSPPPIQVPMPPRSQRQRMLPGVEVDLVA